MKEKLIKLHKTQAGQTVITIPKQIAGIINDAELLKVSYNEHTKLIECQPVRIE